VRLAQAAALHKPYFIALAGGAGKNIYNLLNKTKGASISTYTFLSIAIIYYRGLHQKVFRWYSANRLFLCSFLHVLRVTIH
jgi:hypothetical protein